MKTIQSITAIALFSAIGITASAQKISSAKVPVAVKAAFEKTYPSVKTIKWEKEKTNFEAGFKQSGDEMSAVFEANGTQVESEMEIKPTALPAVVIAYFKEHYKGKTIKEAAKITKTASGEVNYEAEVKGKDLLFDANGKFLKVAKD